MANDTMVISIQDVEDMILGYLIEADGCGASLWAIAKDLQIISRDDVVSEGINGNVTVKKGFYGEKFIGK